MDKTMGEKKTLYTIIAALMIQCSVISFIFNMRPLLSSNDIIELKYVIFFFLTKCKITTMQH